jgi:hypothetical protein
MVTTSNALFVSTFGKVHDCVALEVLPLFVGCSGGHPCIKKLEPGGKMEADYVAPELLQGHEHTTTRNLSVI